jgi:hypothetical protein
MPRWTPKSVKSSCNGIESPGLWNDSGRYRSRQYFLLLFAGGDGALHRFAAGERDRTG